MRRRLFRDQIEDLVLSVPCFQCGAGEGQFCTDETTGNAIDAHAERKVLLRTLRAAPPETPPSRLHRWLGRAVVAALLAPLVVAIFLMVYVPVPLRTLPSGLLLTEIGLFFASVTANLVQQGRSRRIGRLNPGQDRWFAIALTGLMGAVVLAIGIPCVADLSAAPDVYRVTITGDTSDGLPSTRTIHTTGGTFESPLLWAPSVRNGPAMITVGHYSRRVLMVEQS